MRRPITILVADGQQFVRQTLCSMLSQQTDWRIYEAENGRAALDQIREIKPDVAEYRDAGNGRHRSCLQNTSLQSSNEGNPN